ncbi:hypothetical protein Tco_1304447 [Tanacetum coccineum]
MEASVVPAFEMSCKATFDQDAINSSSSMTQILSGELADGQRKLVVLALAGANSDSVNPLITQITNGPIGSFHDKMEASEARKRLLGFLCQPLCHHHYRKSIMASQETQDQPPLWEYVTKLEKQGAAGGVWKFQCNLCSETRLGSYSRVRAYLLGIKGSGIAICKFPTAGDRQKMKQLEEAYEEKNAESNAKEVALPCEAGVGFKKRKRQLEPLRSTWKEKGVTIVSDGWSDPTKPLINFMATSEVINEIGHQNVVQIITDSNAVGQLIESQFPHIY